MIREGQTDRVFACAASFLSLDTALWVGYRTPRMQGEHRTGWRLRGSRGLRIHVRVGRAAARLNKTRSVSGNRYSSLDIHVATSCSRRCTAVGTERSKPAFFNSKVTSRRSAREATSGVTEGSGGSGGRTSTTGTGLGICVGWKGAKKGMGVAGVPVAVGYWLG